MPSAQPRELQTLSMDPSGTASSQLECCWCCEDLGFLQCSPLSLLFSLFSSEESGVVPESSPGSWGNECNGTHLELQQRVWDLEALLLPSAERTQGNIFTAKPMTACSSWVTWCPVWASLTLPCTAGHTAQPGCAESLSDLCAQTQCTQTTSVSSCPH